MLLRRRWMGSATCLLCGAAFLIAVPSRGENEIAKTAAAESEARLKRDVTELASDELEGRGPTTKGLNYAADYIAYQFKKAGLKPGNPDGTWFQPFDIPGSVLDEDAKLSLTGPKKQEIGLKQGVQFWPMGLGGAGKGKDEAVVFAGFGISNMTQKYDDYAGLDVEDRIVVVLRGTPVPGEGQQNPFNQAGSFQSKVRNAETHKAAAILLVNDEATAKDGDDLVDFNYTAVASQRGGSNNIPAFHVKRAVVEQMLKSGADLDLAAVEAEMTKDKKPHSAELKGWTANFEVKMRHTKDAIHLKNVIGVLEGSGDLANETVVVGAHYDHLGYGGSGGSLARGLKKMTIHHGADDNGSGSTAVMELARRLSEYRAKEGDRKSFRRLVFMTFSGEELGLLGSDYYCKNPIFPLEKQYAMLNLDMVGRLPINKDTGKGQLLVEGSNTSSSFDALVETLNKKYDFELKKSATFAANSDHASFYRKKVPIIFFWTGIHNDYHRPTDTSDKINVEGMRKIVDLSEEVLREFVTSRRKLDYVAGKIQVGRGGGGADYPRLGIVPDYAAMDDKGVLVSDVNPGQAAANAGIKKGDLIVEMAGKPIKNMVAYTEVISLQKKGDTIEVVLMRNDKKETVRVKLE